ncbi:hypothetical protein [Methylobacter sp.]|uniref:hypothetical protein n=1 Tax=Methylobacter sp. TaxID=2051955 RepID=UPI003DA68965
MFDTKSISLMIGGAGLILASTAQAQGQITLQQAQAECQSIAQQQSGYNPSAAPTTTEPQAGGRARGAAAGAMAGAAKGKSKANQYGNVPDEMAEEYTKNQMQDAAKVGVVAGAAKQRQQRRQGTTNQQSPDAAANTYNQAYASCMTAKGFPGQ